MKKLNLVLRATLLVSLFCGVAAAQPTVDLSIDSVSGVPTDITLGQGDVTCTINAYNNSSGTARFQ